MNASKDVVESIAICGIGCRFPGSADDPGSFWKLLIEGRSGVTEVPADRWNHEHFFDARSGVAGKTYASAAGFLTQPIDAFDAKFFNISPREASYLDPQQRLLLEVAWEAIEDAGIVDRKLRGSNTGVYVGGFMTDHLLTQLGTLNRDAIGPYTEMGATLGMLANRVSYAFDLRGPSITVDTACSSSLVALHYACQALRDGECEVALAGGVNVMLRPETFVSLAKGGFLAKDGRSKSFDARGDGYGRGEGAGMVVLKPLSAALRDGDAIYAVVRGTGVNQDGRTEGITVPNAKAQAALIRQVLQRSGVGVDQLSYIEAHGTGTAVGDPLEVEALGAAIGGTRAAAELCSLGSVKANIGHLEAAAGIAGLVKVALCLDRGVIPPVANLDQANQKIPFKALGLRLSRVAEPLSGTPGERCAGINSFGYGGTNAHAILQESPPCGETSSRATSGHGPGLLLLSARTRPALAGLAGAYRARLAGDDVDAVADVCYSAAFRRSHHATRVAIAAPDAEGLTARLERFARGDVSDGIVAGEALAHGGKPVFVFSGMGAQWWAMGRELFAKERVYRDTAQACDDSFRRASGWSILEEMFRDQASSRIHETHIAQPATFVIQVSLAALWQSWGIEPGAVVGHSAGEVSSAYVSGKLSLDDAMWVMFHRSRIQRKAAGQGKMLALGLTPEQGEELIAPHDNGVCVAVINSPRSIVLAGDETILRGIAASAEGQGVFNRFVEVEVASHSPSMAPLLPEIRETLEPVRPREAMVPIYSTVTGQLAKPDAFDAAYWCRNIREPVLFSNAIEQILDDGHRLFIEIASHPILSSTLRECFQQHCTTAVVVPSLRRNEPELATLRLAFSEIFVAGAALNETIATSWAGQFRRPPAYPWQRERHWIESEESASDRYKRFEHRLLGRRIESPMPTWEAAVGGEKLAYLLEHVVEGHPVLPGAAYVDIGFAVQRETTGHVGELRDIKFHQALLFEPDEWPQVQVVHDDAKGTYAVYSFNRNRKTWTLHAEGMVGRSPLPATAPPQQPDLAELLGRCPVERDHVAHFADMSRRGLGYGPLFQAIRRIRRSPDGHSVLTEFEAPGGLSTTDRTSLVHPALLDACFQTLLALLDGRDQDDEVYVPVRIRRVRLYRSLPGRYWSLTEQVDESRGSLIGNVSIFDEDGVILAELLDMEIKAISSRKRHDATDLSALMYRARWDPVQQPDLQIDGGRWVVIGQDSEGLCAELTQLGVSNVLAVRPNPGKHLLGCVEQAAGAAGLIWLVPSDPASEASDPVGVQRVSDGLGVVQTLASMPANQRPQLVVVTHNAQSPSQDAGDLSVGQGGIDGLIRVVIAEVPDLRVRVIDVDDATETLASLALEAMAKTVEDDVALRGRHRFVQRVKAVSNDMLLSEMQEQPARIGEEVDRNASGSGEARIVVRATAHSGGQVGPEAGFGDVVDVVGTDTLRVGDRVSFKIDGCVGSCILATPDAMVRVPVEMREALSDESNALMMILVDAYYAMITVGGLAAGERAVIVGASGLEAIAYAYLARLAGAEMLLAAHGDVPVAPFPPAVIGHYAVSSPQFEDDVVAATNGCGADLVIAVAAGAADGSLFSILSEFGRFVHVDPEQGRSLQTHLRPNQSFASVVTSVLHGRRPGLVDQIVHHLCRALAEHPLTSAEVALSEPDGRGPDSGYLADAARPIRSDRTYLVTGGFGGFGFEVAKWLVSRGALHVALAGRRREHPPEITAAVESLRRRGATIYPCAADIGSAGETAAMLADLAAKAPPVSGIFHAAAVLCDGPITGLSRTDVETVMSPKSLGAWHLHTLTADLPIEHFVMFSSISALIGNPGQAAYVAANAVLDRLALRRRAQGLPALSIGWGALSEIGLVARNQEIAVYLDRVGFGRLTPAQAVWSLNELVALNPVTISVAPMDWQKFGSYYPSWAASPRNQELQSGQEDTSGSSNPGEPAGRDGEALAETIKQSVSDILQIPRHEIDSGHSLLEMGIDSLMAMDLQIRCEQKTGIRIPVLELMRSIPLHQLIEGSFALSPWRA